MTTRGTQDTAVELLLAEPERLEAGLVALDSRLKLDEQVEIDVLLRDSLGYPVIVLFCEGEVALELARMAGAAEALQRGRYLLTRLYQNKGLDPSLRPRFVLLGSRFPDSAPRVLDMMSQVEVQAIEYRVVKSSVGRPVLDLTTFHRTGGSGMAPSFGGRTRPATRPARAAPVPAPRAEPPAEAPSPETPPETPVVEAPAGPMPQPAAVDGKTGDGTPSDESLQLVDEPGDGRTLLERARGSIRSLSPAVAEAKEGDRYLFKVEGQLLATLSEAKDGLRVQVGEARPKTVKDEAAFDEQLNAVFARYFDELGPDRLTA